MSESPIDVGALGALKLSPRLRKHPAMVSSAEVALLYGLARDVYSGAGCIVDAGVFLGASTLAFAMGLRESGRANRETPIHAYDSCRFTSGMTHHLERPRIADFLGGRSLVPGDTFESLLREALQGYEDLYELHTEDFSAAPLPSEAVEILFLDILSTRELEEHAFLSFFPLLIPGKSIVVQQDYFFERLPFVKIRQELIADSFEFLGSVGPSAVFRMVAPIPIELMEIDPVSVLSLDEQLVLLEKATARVVEPTRRAVTAFSKVELLLGAGAKVRARQAFREISRDYAPVLETQKGGAYVENALRRLRKALA